MALVWLGALYAHRRKGRASGLFNFSLSAFIRNPMSEPMTRQVVGVCSSPALATACPAVVTPITLHRKVSARRPVTKQEPVRNRPRQKNNQQQPLLSSRYCQQPGVSLSKRIPNTHGYSNVSDPNQSKSFTNKMVDE